MFQFAIVNHPKNFDISEEKIFEIFSYFEKNIEKSQRWTLNIAFLSDEEIQILNRDYRWIDKSTDVLSFHYFDDFTDLDEATDIAWECIFSESKILTQSEEHRHSASEEFYILLIHSVFHILGFDHETDEDFEDMWQLEKPAREFFGLSVKR